MSSSPIRLVVNADGYGKTPAISRGILRAHHEGIVTSTSIVGTVANPEQVCAELMGSPRLGVGLGVVLCNGRPICPAEEIPSLVDPTGHFFATPAAFTLRWLRGHIVPAHLEREIEAQLRRLSEAGLGIDHMDTVLHVGFLPPVAAALHAVARRHGIRSIRSRVESPTLTWFVDPERGLPLAALSALSALSRTRLGVHGHGALSWGFSEAGGLSRPRILEILGRLGPGIHELICHPGEDVDTDRFLSGRTHVFDRRSELEALISPAIRDAIDKRGIELVRFSDLF